MNRRFYNFGGFRLDTHNQRLLRDGEAITLTLKQFELLLALVENAGDVVSKDALFEMVWKDVAVADETLTRNISWLRQKLGDGEFIETVPKRGYRFAADVTTSDQPEIYVEETTLTRVRVEETITLPEIIAPEIARHEKSHREIAAVLPAAHEIAPPTKNNAPPHRSTFYVLFALLAVVAFASTGFILYQNYFAQTKATTRFIAEIKLFSGARGRENSPAFSPDSKQIAYSWDGGERENSDIYVQLIGAGEPVRLTDTEVQEHYPVFSPDGTHIAFVRDFKTHAEIVLIPALGGAERRIARLFSGNYSISFAPDGKSVAAVDAIDDKGKRYAVFAIDLKNGERRRLAADGDFQGETTPRFAPDGRSLAFVRVFHDYTQDLYTVSTSGENNEPVRLTSDRKTIHSLAWGADGAEIFFVSLRESSRPNIWRIGAAGGAPEIFLNGSQDVTNLAAAPDGKRIAFVENTLHSDIYRLTIGESQLKSLVATNHSEDTPSLSPDGRRFVFRSNRSGNSEVWIADADGKNPRQVTDSIRQVGSTRFSPDGTQLVFNARDGENMHIYTVSVESGEPRQLFADASSESHPAWSADGKFIVFSSDRSGEKQLWRISANGGDAVQITRGGGTESAVSADNRWIYYIKDAPDAGLWRVSANATNENSDETPISKLYAEGFRNAWTLTEKGVIFIASAEKSPAKIKFYDFSTEQVSELAENERILLSQNVGMTAAPDGKTILIAQFDQNAGSIMFAEIEK